MNNTKILYPLTIGAALFSSCTDKTPQKEKSEKPNIVILFTDDLGYGDLSSFGHPTIKTPHLDRMAEEGMKMTQFYVAASISTPSRGALLTGRLPVRTGIHTGVFFPDSEFGIPEEEITTAEALKAQGYATACFGKWHLGHKKQYLPTNNGFDEYFGIPYSNDMGGDPEAEWERKRNFPLLPLMEGTEVIEENPDQSKLTRQYTEHAIDFIQRNKENPFFLYVPYTFPHVPLFASDSFKGTSSRGLYGDVVQEIDWSVGKIINTLKKQGLDKNTLVFFTSDNGPWLVKDTHGGSAGLLRGGKFTTWEGGMREPAIAWWPGTIEAGQISEAIASSMDLYVTALKLGGAKVPDDRVVDGVDLMPVLTGSKKSVRNTFFYYRGSELQAVRKGPWKAHFITVDNVYTKDFKWEQHDPPLLFNIEEDPSEKYNIAEEHPEIIKEIKALVKKHQENLTIAPSVINPPKDKENE